ncbi:unnamed protein product [Kluyveromyces dobzhanskii CBS 2104]|uniref:Aminopeptidase n=1 Tax=Kluyveromyces dobzhanskii CBS 2104 TaxID=1427455 RepID=A0A0A8L484_9SACH|nr:unnamed protein product [Kluyveromyces dobzhanskii CBS 2104]
MSEVKIQTLPTDFRADHYEIELSELSVEKNEFIGSVRIHMSTVSANDTISLNMRDIEIVSATVKLEEGQTLELKDRTVDFENDVVSLLFPEVISNKKFVLCISYKGIIQTNMSGFYRSDYTDFVSGESRVMFSTQFEATDARRAFPCLDEPSLKATFSVSIIAHEKFVVLSNMPLSSSKKLQESDQVCYRFHTTPLMSTYLVAWAIGEYDFIESETEKSIYPTIENYNTLDGSSSSHGKLPVRVYTAKGKAQQGRFALGVAKKAIDFFSESFDIPYPLPKLDLLCVESYSHNAMENFSLITFRPSALLYDGNLEEADANALQKIAYVVCHEIAHQWFGNLVTMKWWDELWLNEGFATWIGYLAVEKFFPDWDVPSMIMLQSHEVALELDSLKESHPIKVAVRNAKDIDQVFDSISYLKGCSILEMLSGYLGHEIFLKGVALYLKRNKFSNATMVDLFNCIGEVANVEVLERSKDWILTIGYPLVTVSESERGLIFTQSRFLSARNSTPEEDATKWWIPLMPEHGDYKAEFSEKSIEVSKTQFGHINSNAFGFYRVKYDSESLFQEQLQNLHMLSSRGKMGLISDVEVTGSVKNLLTLLSKCSTIQDPNEYYVWSTVFETLNKMKSLLSSDAEIKKILNKFTLELIQPSTAQMLQYLEQYRSNSSRKSSKNFLSNQFFELLALVAGTASHPETVGICREMFESNSYSSGFRNILSQVILSQPDTTKRTVDFFLAEFKTATLVHKEGLLTALGKVQNPELFATVLNLLLTIEPMDVQFLATSLGSNSAIRSELWSFIKTHYEELHKRLAINSVVIDRFLKFSMKDFIGDDVKKDYEAFFSDRNLEGFDRGVRQTLERIDKNTKYSETNIPLIKEYFKV